jgi:hypothetical protein
MPEAQQEELFQKDVVRLPDGRQLIYYRFPEAPPTSAPAGSPQVAPTAGKER